MLACTGISQKQRREGHVKGGGGGGGGGGAMEDGRKTERILNEQTHEWMKKTMKKANEQQKILTDDWQIN